MKNIKIILEENATYRLIESRQMSIKIILDGKTRLLAISQSLPRTDILYDDATSPFLFRLS